MKNNTEINRIYRQIAFASILFERLLLMRAGQEMLDNETNFIKENRAYLDLLSTLGLSDAFDPKKLKKYIETAIIREYVAKTKIANCFSCETGLEMILKNKRFCSKILVPRNSRTGNTFL